MSTEIKIKRGSGETPALKDGELGFNKDTKILSIGTDSGNVDVGRPILRITKDAYDALAEPDDNTIYVIESDDAVVTNSVLEEGLEGRLRYLHEADLADYGISVVVDNDVQINSTIEEICAALPAGCIYTLGWTGNTPNDSGYRFGTIGEQLPYTYGKLYIYKVNSNNADLKFVKYDKPDIYISTWTKTNSIGWSGWRTTSTYTYGIEELEAGVSALPTGTIYYCYE
jgi:hypothetical protein